MNFGIGLAAGLRRDDPFMGAFHGGLEGMSNCREPRQRSQARSKRCRELLFAPGWIPCRLSRPRIARTLLARKGSRRGRDDFVDCGGVVVISGKGGVFCHAAPVGKSGLSR